MTSVEHASWLDREPGRVRDLLAHLDATQSEIHHSARDGDLKLVGKYHVFGAAGDFLGAFDVDICFPSGFPENEPILKETGGRLPRIPDRHVGKDGIACVMVPGEWVLRRGPEAADALAYFEGPLRDFFLSQLSFEETGQWPFGQRSHSTDGVAEFLREYFEIPPQGNVLQIVRSLLNRDAPRRSLCPCGSRKPAIKCHRDQIIHAKAMLATSQIRGWLSMLEQGSTTSSRAPKGFVRRISRVPFPSRR